MSVLHIQPINVSLRSLGPSKILPAYGVSFLVSPAARFFEITSHCELDDSDPELMLSQEKDKIRSPPTLKMMPSSPSRAASSLNLQLSSL